MKSHSRKPFLYPQDILAALAVVVFVGSMLLLNSWRPVADKAVSEPPPRTENIKSIAAIPPAAPKRPMTDEELVQEAYPNFPDFEVRPFAVVRETSANQWTAENGKDTNVIHQLAHNSLEEARLLKENERILRRQLVYRKESFHGSARQIRAGKEPVHSIRIPYFDGQEFEVELDRTEFVNSGKVGDFTGHIKGDPEAVVVFSFVGGIEAYILTRPGMNQVEAEPREPGQLVLKEQDPDAPPMMIDAGGVPPPRPTASN